MLAGTHGSRSVLGLLWPAYRGTPLRYSKDVLISKLEGGRAAGNGRCCIELFKLDLTASRLCCNIPFAHVEINNIKEKCYV